MRAVDAGYRQRAKRLLDVAGAIVLLVITSPTIAIIGALIWLRMGKPILFQQERLGQYGRVFTVQKFRTMTHRERTSHEEILGDHPEIPPLGQFLRRTKVDELPQLWNILKGDMSFVGPRPALVEHLELYDDVSRRRLEVRPGLTGLAQVSGNARLTWPERWRLDVAYVDSQSLWLDLNIVVKTFAVVLLGEQRLQRVRVRDDG